MKVTCLPRLSPNVVIGDPDIFFTISLGLSHWSGDGVFLI